MNPYIISQWYKYRDNLKQYYSDNSIDPLSDDEIRKRRRGMIDLCAKCNGKKGYCDVCIKNEDGYYQPLADPRISVYMWWVSIVDIDDIVLKNLLTYVINQGEDDLDLHLVDYSRKSLDGYSFNSIFLLRDRDGDFWMMKYYFGTDDCFRAITDEGTQEEFVNYLMHVSLIMVQNLELVNIHTPNTLLVANGKHNYIGVECVLSLEELSLLTAWDKLTYYKVFSHRIIDVQPLYNILSQSQKEEIKSLLNAGFDVNLQVNSKLTEQEKYILASEYFTNSIANQLFNKLQEYNLKGYLAVCSSTRLCADNGSVGIIENVTKKHSKCGVSTYIKEEYDGSEYFVVVGDTIEDLMHEVQRYMEQSFKKGLKGHRVK